MCAHTKENYIYILYNFVLIRKLQRKIICCSARLDYHSWWLQKIDVQETQPLELRLVVYMVYAIVHLRRPKTG